jgi:hypothetical protein
MMMVLLSLILRLNMGSALCASLPARSSTSLSRRNLGCISEMRIAHIVYKAPHAQLHDCKFTHEAFGREAQTTLRFRQCFAAVRYRAHWGLTPPCFQFQAPFLVRLMPNEGAACESRERDAEARAVHRCRLPLAGRTGERGDAMCGMRLTGRFGALDTSGALVVRLREVAGFVETAFRFR